MRISSAPRSDVVLAVFVIAIIAMLLIPLPTWLLDILLAVNLSFALLLLLVGLYTHNALSLLAFPSILLLSTLFRLGLNVASTRLILSQADAGRVIEAFGTFLIRGEIVVGIIIFTIITVVNIIVIAKGSSRVSEVAARFALDALPGKQMAIDSDLRAGLLTPDEAHQQRDALRKESQLYGSMDGAMKFVQGDAFIGFFITITNIVGGMYMGLSQGMEFQEAIQTYVMLTVGDGLVSQIPALLVSICAGIIVTRVSSGEDATLGSDMGSQLFARPGTVFFSGLLLIGIAMLPGIPSMPFIIVGLAVLGFSFWSLKLPERATPSSVMLPITDGLGSARELPAPKSKREESVDEAALEYTLDEAVLFRLYINQAERYQNWWEDLRDDYYDRIGLKLPMFVVKPGQFTSGDNFRINVNDVAVKTGRVPFDCVLVELSPDSAPILGLQVEEIVRHPIGGSSVFWAQHTPALRKIVDAARIRTYDFFEYMALLAAVFYRSNPEELITLADVHVLLRTLEKQYPGLVKDALNTNFITLPRLTEIIHELVRQGVNVKDFRQIVEAVAGYCGSYGVALDEEDNFNLEEVVSYIRRSRRRHVMAPLLSGRHTLKVVRVSDDLEERLERVRLASNDIVLPLNGEEFDRLGSQLRVLLEPIVSRGLPPVSVLCSEQVRHKITILLRSIERAMSVVSIEELEPGINIETVGIWG